MKFLNLLGPIFFLSCASRTTDVKKNYTAQFENYLINNKCEEAESQIPVEKDESRFIRFYNGALGHLVYLSTTPVTIGIDILLMVRCNISDCRVKPEKWLQEAFPLSVYTHENTKEFRCPDTSYYVNKVIEISKCYEDRGDKESYSYAYAQLKYIQDSYDSFGPSCMKKEDYKKIKLLKERLEAKLHSESM